MLIFNILNFFAILQNKEATLWMSQTAVRAGRITRALTGFLV